jgi:hypothetical protein
MAVNDPTPETDADDSQLIMETANYSDSHPDAIEILHSDTLSNDEHRDSPPKMQIGVDAGGANLTTQILPQRERPGGPIEVESNYIHRDADGQNDSHPLRWSFRKNEEPWYGDFEALYPVESGPPEGRTPPIHREKRVDEEGRALSIEVLPEGKTREECQKRITASWNP